MSTPSHNINKIGNETSILPQGEIFLKTEPKLKLCQPQLMPLKCLTLQMLESMQKLRKTS